jgi:hypothetical protein
MTEKEIQEKSFALYAKLLDKGFISKTNETAIPFLQEDGVKLCIQRLAKSQGTEVFEWGTHIHLITMPEGSLFATSYSQALGTNKQLEVVDWHIIGSIQMVFCWEIDNDFSHKLSIEREGVTYPQLEEMTTKLFSDWRKIDEKNEGSFSEEFKIAVFRMNEKWEKLQYQKPKTRYSLNSRAGLIHKAMQIFREGKLVHISDSHKRANIIYPTDILYERLEYVFHNLDRYQLLKSLINDSLENYKYTDSRMDEIKNEKNEREGTA